MIEFIKFNFEDELSNVPLWHLQDGVYRLYIKSEIHPFKNGERAVKTSRGFISIKDLFRHADDGLKSLFFSDGSFILNTEIELEVEMKNKGVVRVRKV